MTFSQNNTESESVAAGTDRKEVLAGIQRGFEYQFRAYGKAKNGEHNPDMEYNAKQGWKRLQRLIIKKITGNCKISKEAAVVWH